MAKIVRQAPARVSTANSLLRNPARILPSSLLAVVAALFLVACGTTPLPPGIQPSEDGNFVLLFQPADAQVVVVEESFEATSFAARGASTTNGNSGKLRYDLPPGRYKVRITKPGYKPVEQVVEIPEYDGETTAAPAEVDLEVTLEPDPDASTGGGEDGNATVTQREYSMRGDPSFDVASLTDQQLVWYERMWAATRNPDNMVNPDSMAASDDTYAYARDLHSHLQTLLIVFRATGDLKLLDEVDRLTQIMASKLRDEWTGTLDGTDGTRDGYRGWAFRYGSYPEFEGKDVHETNDVKTHAVIATVAYALEANRDLASPTGREYGAHADFWKEYLVEDFEAKWRERKRKSSGFPVLMRPHTHTYMSGLKYHYYMYKLTGVQGYLDEAERNSRVLWDNEIKKTSVASGSGYVWPRSVLSEGGSENYLHPTTYARYVYTDAIELYFEGFDRWANEENLSMMANPVAEWVIDREGARDGWDWFASDIGGGKTRGGIPSESGWKRLNTLGFTWAPYTLLAHWDDSGRIAGISEEVLISLGKLSTPGAIHVPAGMFLDLWMNAN